jgi:membrane-bound serine protease (ClpP class)
MEEIYSRGFTFMNILRSSIAAFLILFSTALPSFAGKTGTEERDASRKMSSVVLTVKGVINPIMASYVKRGISEAEKENAICIMLMDTPGGLMEPMREINQKISSSYVPVVVFIYPEGARAGSAGVYITYASHIAAMAPSTNIGAAHPVFVDQTGGFGKGKEKDKEGKESKTSSKTEEYEYEKVTNDSVAMIKALAAKHHRNAKWAENAVRKSVSITAPEALKLKVIEVIARDVPDLLKKIDGREVELPLGRVKIHPASTPPKEIPMTAIERFLLVISDPNIAFILFILGMSGITMEFYHPGTFIPGSIGAACLIMALYSFGSLPINYAGLSLIILSFILFFLEIKAPTHGIFTILAIICMVLGAVFLIPSGHPYLSISRSLIAATTTIISLVFIIVISLIIATMKRLPVSGKEELVGAVGEARTELAPEGTVFVLGALWRAKSAGDRIPPGSAVKVSRIQGLKLYVEKTEEEKPL